MVDTTLGNNKTADSGQKASVLANKDKAPFLKKIKLTKTKPLK